MSEHDTNAKSGKPTQRTSLAEWAIRSMYLPPILLAIFVLYYFIEALLGLG